MGSVVHAIDVDHNKCSRCGNCVKVCWQNVLRFDEKGFPVAAYPHECQVCLLCEIMCPTGAIKVVPDWSDAYWPPPIAHPSPHAKW